MIEPTKIETIAKEYEDNVMMTVKEITDYCMSKLGAILDYPFGPGTAVFKAGGKMFALIYEENDTVRISLKCDPLLADFLRQQYSSVIPGYHFNKVHWNTVICDASIPDGEIYNQIDNSHELILKSLSKKKRKHLYFYYYSRSSPITIYLCHISKNYAIITIWNKRIY